MYGSKIQGLRGAAEPVGVLIVVVQGLGSIFIIHFFGPFPQLRELPGQIEISFYAPNKNFIAIYEFTSQDIFLTALVAFPSFFQHNAFRYI